MAQKKRKAGKRHAFLLYRRTVDRLWKSTFVLGLVLAAVWAGMLYWPGSLFDRGSETIIFVASIVLLLLAVLAYLGRFRAYIRAHSTHISIVTPIYHLKVSYKRVSTIHPTAVQQLFPPDGASWSETSFMAPFYGMTAVVVELNSYPMSMGLMRLFLPAQMFARTSRALVLIVKDWMELSTELDTFQSQYRQAQKSRNAAVHTGWGD